MFDIDKGAKRVKEPIGPIYITIGAFGPNSSSDWLALVQLPENSTY